MGATGCCLDLNFKILQKIKISHESHFKFSTVLVAGDYCNGHTENVSIIPERSTQQRCFKAAPSSSICDLFL